MTIKRDYKKTVDFVFWIVFILFTNPGGVLEALGEDSGSGGINITDLLFVVLFICYVFIFQKKDLKKNKTYNIILKLIIVTALYHFIVYNLFVPIFKGTLSVSNVFVLIKSRHEAYSVALFIMVYRFFIRSHVIFFKSLLYSSIIILILFLISIPLGIEILPVLSMTRGFVDVDRIFLINYGLMPLLIPMGIVVIAFKLKLKWRQLILIGFVLMFLAWLVSLTRRHIFGTLVYLFIAIIFSNYFLNKTLIPFNKVFTVFFYSVLTTFFVYITFPKYIDAGVKTVEETVYVIKYGETSTGKKDVRLGLGKDFMQKKIKENYLWGTGFDNRWRTGAGDREGWEAGDYPFLSAIAMKGIIGLLIFLPIYLLLIKTIFYDVKFIKKYKVDFHNVEFFMIVLFILFFTFNLIQYMNLFKPISRMKDYDWYMYLAMYLGSRYLFYNSAERIEQSSK